MDRIQQLLSFIVLVLCVSFVQAGNIGSLFETVSVSKDRGKGYVAIQLNERLFELNSGDQLSFVAPTGTSYSVIFEKLSPSGQDSVTWLGRIADSGLMGRVILTRRGSVINGIFNTKDGRLLLEQETGQLWLVDHQLTGQSAIARGQDTVSLPQTEALGELGADNPQAIQLSANGVDKIATIDVMVVYNNAFKLAHPNDGWLARLDFLFASANQAYIDSQVNMRIRLVHSVEVDYDNVNDITASLNTLVLNKFPNIDIPTLRNQYKADLVVLIRPLALSHGFCGLANLLDDLSSSVNPDISMYSSVSDGGSGGFFCDIHTLAHEIGHNLGGLHDRANASASGLYSYNYGYGIDGQFGTIMSYLSPTVGFFSNPNISLCDGLPCGVNKNASNAADNALALNNVKWYAANYRLSPDQVTLNLTVQKGGAVSIASLLEITSCGALCELPYESNTPLQLTAIAEPNFVFAGWQGLCTGMDSCFINLAQSGEVTALFNELDTDNDGLPDYWESRYGLNPASAADATLDSDQDQWDNLTEYQQGTHPFLADTDYDGVVDGLDLKPLDQLIMESFETAELTRLAWVHGGQRNWHITQDHVFQGDYALRVDDALTDNELTEIGFVVTTLAGELRFWYKVSSEKDWDKLHFFIDGVDQGSQSGDLGWAELVFPLSAGEHHFLWRYVKDESISLGQDAAWIDSISFPANLDSDGDGVFDALDAFILDPSETLDSDLDGVGNNADLDDDNDLIPDSIELQFGLNPLNASDATADLDGDGENNVTEYLQGTALNVDTVAPIITPPETISLNANGVVISMDAGQATAQDHLDGAVIATSTYSNLVFSGLHRIIWTASDTAGNQTSVEQLIRIHPQLSFAPDQNIAEGANVDATVYLSGDASAYPVSISYTASGTAEAGSDYDVLSGNLSITEGRVGQVSLVTQINDNTEQDETLILTMNNPEQINAGDKNYFTLGLLEAGNSAPQVALSSLQGLKASRMVFKDAGSVQVKARIMDADVLNQHQFDWSRTDNALVDSDGDVSNAEFQFDPSNVSEGFYQVSVKVTDNGLGALESTMNLMLQVVATAPVLGRLDSDQDGISDLLEGMADTDQDGIPDYLDAMPVNYALEGRVGSREYAVTGEAGFPLRLGDIAFRRMGFSTKVTASDITNEPNHPNSEADSVVNVGGYVDLEVIGVALGETAFVVIPQAQAIPVSAQYRLYQSGIGWKDFTLDTKNQIFSAPGIRGVCPSAGDVSYVVGLHADDFCVQLRIEDGSQNDGDATLNGRILHTGGIGQLILSDGDLAPLGARDGAITVADALIALRYALALISDMPSDDLAHGDVAPLGLDGKPAPDGKITVADALIILRKSLGLVDF